MVDSGSRQASGLQSPGPSRLSPPSPPDRPWSGGGQSHTAASVGVSSPCCAARRSRCRRPLRGVRHSAVLTREGASGSPRRSFRRGRWPCDSAGLGRARECAFLTSSRIMLLLVQGRAPLRFGAPCGLVVLALGNSVWSYNKKSHVR